MNELTDEIHLLIREMKEFRMAIEKSNHKTGEIARILQRFDDKYIKRR